MALCEGQLDNSLLLKNEGCNEEGEKTSQEKNPPLLPNGDIYGLNQVPAGLPLSVDYRSPVSHFIPTAVEIYAARQETSTTEPITAGDNPELLTPGKRKRGRPRIDKTSPEYIAKSAARKQARQMAAVMSSNGAQNEGEPGVKRKRGRPRVDKTSDEYVARRRARELEAYERKAKREYRRTGPDSAASSSDTAPRVKRKYTKRLPGTKKADSALQERVKGKRGRPRKSDILAGNTRQTQQPKIRVRSNLMPSTTETITLDSDEEPDLGSPEQASELSLDENLRALRHIHEKYANLHKDDLYEAHLLAANFKKPLMDQKTNRDDDEVLSIRSSEGRSSVKELDTRIEKLEDSSNSDSDSTSSGSGSSSSGSSSSSSSESSSSSDSSDSESESGEDKNKTKTLNTNNVTEDRRFGVWPEPSANVVSDSDSDPEKSRIDPAPARDDEISESENESPDKSFQCHICRKWYSTRVTLKIHRRIHQNRGGSGTSRSRSRARDRYECDCCAETFSRREKMWEHKAEVHRGSMTVRCEVCRRCFEDDAELAAHDALHTDDERAGRCSECGATFAKYEQLRRHASTAHGGLGAHGAHGEHACTQCGKRFGHAHSLARHAQNHAKQLYRCVVCKASFARADQLAQHLNSHLANYKRLKP